ncbi:hypothetical protein QYE76_041445 [Lolium multiflorum]|uniref:Uncharacterized protein n=1 Tax=Lolium multiflorum TaxID=4521 RepID=A0AAD8WTT7_LOLMU|nr:hypothetical protein QYE76_041445 [Lolium multiflorum]
MHTHDAETDGCCLPGKPGRASLPPPLHPPPRIANHRSSPSARQGATYPGLARTQLAEAVAAMDYVTEVSGGRWVLLEEADAVAPSGGRGCSMGPLALLQRAADFATMAALLRRAADLATKGNRPCYNRRPALLPWRGGDAM